MLDKIFKRWDIGVNGRISFIHCANAARIKRALRLMLPDKVMTINKYHFLQLWRLGEAMHNGGIHASMTSLSGGPGYELNCKKLKQELS